MPMHRWMANAAGGASHRLKPGPAIVRSRSNRPKTGKTWSVIVIWAMPVSPCVSTELAWIDLPAGARACGGPRPVRGLGGRLPEARRLFGPAGGVASAIRVRARSRELAAIDDQVFVADRPSVEPALQNLAGAGRIAGLG